MLKIHLLQIAVFSFRLSWGGEEMGGQWRSRLLHSEVTKFVLKTIFYFVVMLILVYLYSYSGINGPHFIYNEF